jgi:tetratricopeptide (TPR) repeat protein
LKQSRLFPFITAAVILTVALGCSTKKNTFTRRVYHNLTAHYNAYFNGKEAYNEAVSELAKKNKDNFAKVIPVFQYGTKADAQSVYPQLDRAIEKGSKVISKHSIYIKRVEHVKWIDDAYFLIGKSYLYKQEYDLAIQTFNFIRDRYKGNTIIYDAVLYQARTLCQQGRYSDAEALVATVDKKIEKNKATRHIEKLFPLVMADLCLQQEQYDRSVEYLQQAYDLNKNKKVRCRTAFILGQVLQRLGNNGKATEMYKDVLGYNPVYDMEFAAKINMAKCYDAGSGDSREIRKKLRKMINDDKNKEFLDQIYYALAEIDLKESDTAAAKTNLKASARNSVSNNYQKGVSYLKLADIYYKEMDYRPAQIFYDSAVQALPREYPNIAAIESKRNTLTELVKNLDVVVLQDSLQKMGKMPYNERIQMIDNIIKDIIKEEERKRQEEIDRQNALANLQQMGFQNQQTGTGNWYFENPQTVTFGITEFTKKWGNRKLEDLWRFSNKVVMSFDFNEDNTQNADSSSDTTKAYVFDPKDRNAYLKVIPTTPEDFAKSDKKIIEALFNIGTIYKDGLMDYEKSVEAFETLFNRYPDNDFLLQSYYYLYRIYTEEEDFAKAEQYKNLILSKFPDSDYAKIIKDPDYYQKIDSLAGLEEKYYSQTFKAFQEGRFPEVIHAADSAIKRFQDKSLYPKFAYLRAIAIGKTQGDSLMINPLKQLISTYPSSDVVPLAKALLAYVTGDKTLLGDGAETNNNGTTKPVAAESPYVYDPEGFHFYICVFDAAKVKLPEIKNLYSDHNTSIFKFDKLTVNSMFLNNTLQMITVNRFDNKQKAMDYFTSVSNNAAIIAKLAPANMKHFVISANNYTTFFKLKDVSQYLEFFDKNYRNQ